MVNKRDVIAFEQNRVMNEEELCSFYATVLMKHYKITRRRFMVELVWHLNFFKCLEYSDIKKIKSIQFKNKLWRVSYVFSYGIIHTVIVYEQFLFLLKNIATLFDNIKIKDKIKLCILGGGTAAEVVAISKLINDIIKNVRTSNNRTNDLYVTIIDCCAEWNHDIQAIIKLIIQRLCDAENVKLQLNFITANIAYDFSDRMRIAIQISDYVIMVKLIPDVNYEFSNRLACRGIPDIFCDVFESMHPNACLFYLDTKGDGRFQTVDAMIDKMPNTKRVYGPYLHNKYTLSEETVQVFTNEIAQAFSKHKLKEHYCIKEISISCSAWIKSHNISNLKNVDILLDARIFCILTLPEREAVNVPNIEQAKEWWTEIFGNGETSTNAVATTSTVTKSNNGLK